LDQNPFMHLSSIQSFFEPRFTIGFHNILWKGVPQVNCTLTTVQFSISIFPPRILQHFNTTMEDYTVIFTSGSTAALKLVAETFPWIQEGLKSPASRFCYLTDSHTSVVGMRGITAAMNVIFVPIKPKDMLLSEKNRATAEAQNCTTPHLFCFPAQSNFSGTKYPLLWIEEIQSGKCCPIQAPGKWFVLLDAASYVSTSSLDLGVHQADFVPISFYKIFVFPTGLGALLVRNQVAHFLRKTYFGGGTAAAYLGGEDFYSPRQSLAERFEDGTVAFLDIIALKHGFDALEKLTGGMENIKHHTFALAHYTYTVLSTLKYANGAPVVCIYSDTDFSSPDIQGPIINFNVLDKNGDIIGYSQVDKMASLFNIHIRTGCFCNTGACQQHLGISNEDIKKNLQAGHVCGDDVDLIDGCPTGSVRISFGYMSAFEDAQAFLKFIIATSLPVGDQTDFLSQTTPRETITESTGSPRENICTSNNVANKLPWKTINSDTELWNNSCMAGKTMNFQPPVTESEGNSITPSIATGPRSGRKPITVTNIYLYPIKSCSAFEVTEWPVGSQGLLYDRNWMIVNQNGVCITQKQEPTLCLIQPLIDREQNIMIIKAEGVEPISVPLEETSERENPVCQSKVCAHRVQTYDCGERIAGWLSEFLHRQCRLIRQSSDFKINANKNNEKDQTPATATSLSLVNEAQYLLINRESISYFSKQIATRSGEPLLMQELIERFRANIVISAAEPYEEETWMEISIGALHFQIVGQCHRCQIICIDQKTGQRNNEILQSLSSNRDRKVSVKYTCQMNCCLDSWYLPLGYPFCSGKEECGKSLSVGSAL
uniref:Molybdenum cofactor sulfurase n=1 Tax=Sphenodon punctatus TaxID=8508 RepID=A0A8D0H6U7_SPHPU